MIFLFALFWICWIFFQLMLCCCELRVFLNCQVFHVLLDNFYQMLFLSFCLLKFFYCFKMFSVIKSEVLQVSEDCQFSTTSIRFRNSSGYIFLKFALPYDNVFHDFHACFLTYLTLFQLNGFLKSLTR